MCHIIFYNHSLKLAVAVELMNRSGISLVL